MRANNDNLHRAKRVKNDEFYTFYEDIENELQHYLHHFKDKVILCPCDDWTKSNFYKYFKDNFENLGLKKLITVCYNANGKGVLHILTKDGEYTIILQGDGDFRNRETIDLLDESDIVVTNPPFSLFRDFVNILMEHDKKFLIIGNKNALTSKTIFPLIRDNKIWLGHTSPKLFYQPLTDETKNVTGLTRWFSDLSTSKIIEPFDTGVTYEQGVANGWYKKYDNYDAINVNKVSQIPMDYDGVIGVPITFIDKYNPEQFEILGMTQRGCHDRVPDIKKYDNYFEMKPDGTPTGSKGCKTNENGNLATNDGKKNYFIDTATGHIVQSTYQRIFIKRK